MKSMQPVRLILCSLALFLLTALPAFGTDQQPTNSPAGASPFDGKPIKGTVIQTMNSGGYTYLKLKTSQGEVWVAIPETKVAQGKEVTCNPGMAMKNFESKTLKKTFDTIIFSTGLGGKMKSPHGAMMAGTEKKSKGMSFSEALQKENSGAGMAAAMGGGAAAMSGGSTSAIVPSADIKVEKAAGANGHTVGECFAQAKDLDGKKIRVRGKVMKVSRMIMGRNWVHLQDGTGNPMENTHDLVITTKAEPKKGSIVTMEGTLHANRDFGAGYKYQAIIEDAEVVQK